MGMRKKRKRKMVKKKKVYKYYVNTIFDGYIQKALVEKEGKTEAVVTAKTALQDFTVSMRIKKSSNDGVLCDSFNEARKLIMKYKTDRIKHYKKLITKLEAERKKYKEMTEEDVLEKYTML